MSLLQDLDDVAEFLRKTYREYQRIKIGPFKTAVNKSIEAIKKRGGIRKAELVLQDREAQHQRSRGMRGDQDSDSDDSSGSKGKADDSGDSGGELDGEAAQEIAQGTTNMNSALLSMYGKAPRPEPAPAPGPSTAAEERPEASRGDQEPAGPSGRDKKGGKTRNAEEAGLEAPSRRCVTAAAVLTPWQPLPDCLLCWQARLGWRL